MKPIPLRIRLTLLYTTILFLCLGGIVLLTYKFLSDGLNTALNNELVEIATGLRGYMSFSGGEVTLNYDPNDPEEAFFVRNATRFYQVYDADTGELLDQSPDLELLGMRYTPSELRSVLEGPSIHEVNTDQGRLRFINNVIAANDGEMYLLEVGATTRAVDDSLGQFLKLLLWIFPASLLLSAAAAWLAAGHALKPLRTMADVAHRINVNDLAYRLPLRKSGDELDQFASAFNETLQRLQHSVEEMRQFTGSIAHELRTPITALRGEAELALMNARSEEDYRRLLGSQLEEFEKLTRIINEVLTLARAESGEIVLKSEPVDLGRIVRNVVEDLEPIAASKGIQIKNDGDSATMIAGDNGWIERAVVNLLDNAIKFTLPGGSVFVTVATNENVVLTVRDTGVGISRQALPHIFERFFQEDASRSIGGAGLGLSLVRWIIEQHKGSVTATSEPGHGASLQVVLPRSANINLN